MRLLGERGIVVTQSCISRDLARLGAMKGAGGYSLRPLNLSEEDRRTLSSYARAVHAAGPNLTVVRTATGAAQRIALFLDPDGLEGGPGDAVGRRYHLHRDAKPQRTAGPGGPAAPRSRPDGAPERGQCVASSSTNWRPWPRTWVPIARSASATRIPSEEGVMVAVEVLNEKSLLQPAGTGQRTHGARAPRRCRRGRVGPPQGAVRLLRLRAGDHASGRHRADPEHGRCSGNMRRRQRLPGTALRRACARRGSRVPLSRRARGRPGPRRRRPAGHRRADWNWGGFPW